MRKKILDDFISKAKKREIKKTTQNEHSWQRLIATKTAFGQKTCQTIT
jgi:hypothetical protein